MLSIATFRERPLAAMLIGLLPASTRGYRPSVNFAACATLLACSFLLGGGTRSGFLSDTILQLAAIPTVLIAFSSLARWSGWRTKVSSEVQWAFAFCIAIVFLPLIQLVPLPPPIWTRLPGHEEVRRVFELLGRPLPWMPISVSPHATWLSLLSLLPPMAVFFSAIQLSHEERRRICLVIIALGLLSAFLGLLQVAQGQNSALRFFSVTNDTEAVGFFANRNHFSAFLYAVLLFAAVWAIDLGFKTGSLTDIRTFQTSKILLLTAMLLILIIVIAAEAMARSRAGLALTMLSLLAIFAIAFRDRRNISGEKTGKLLLLAISLAIFLSLQFALFRILDRFAVDPLENARAGFAQNTIQAAKAFMPFGSGLGTFVPIYSMFETPADVIPDTYANHAHNDILEMWLETGVMGQILFALFLAWLGYRSWKVWRRQPAGASAFDYGLARAATVVIWLIIAHSFVDYPMRTEAIMALVAVSCALLMEPVRNAETESAPPMESPRRVMERKYVPEDAAKRRPSFPMTPLQTSELNHLARPPERWRPEVEWPDQWRDSGPGQGPTQHEHKSESGTKVPEKSGPGTEGAK
jgi:O-antigen ligase